jgi:hypothetical protein
LFSKKLENAHDELKKINRDKFLMKYFPNINKDYLALSFINNISFDNIKTFNHNFITFNIEKIYKYKNNMESSGSNLNIFFDNLLSKLINEHEILYEYNKKFFFKIDTNYQNYKNILNNIESLIKNKKYDNLNMREFLDNKFNEKQNAYEITSGICDNIKNTNKMRYNKTFAGSKINEEKMLRNNSFNSNNDIKIENSIISPLENSEYNLNVSVKIENFKDYIINDYQKDSKSSNSGGMPIDETMSQSEDSINNNTYNHSLISPIILLYNNCF